jgi:hypothetical protein
MLEASGCDCAISAIPSDGIRSGGSVGIGVNMGADGCVGIGGCAGIGADTGIGVNMGADGCAGIGADMGMGACPHEPGAIPSIGACIGIGMGCAHAPTGTGCMMGIAI